MLSTSRVGILVPFSCFLMFCIYLLKACLISSELLKLYFCRFYSGILCLSLNVVPTFWLNDLCANDTGALQPCSCRVRVSGSITFSPEAGLQSSKGEFLDPCINFIFIFLYLCALRYMYAPCRLVCYVLWNLGYSYLC